MNGQRASAYKEAARHADPLSIGQLAVLLFPTSALHRLFQSAFESYRRDAKFIDRQRIFFMDQIDPCLTWVFACLDTCHVEKRFAGKPGIYAAVPAHRSAHRLVRVNTVAFEPEIRHGVRALKKDAVIVSGHYAETSVGSAVDQNVRIQRRDAFLRVKPHSHRYFRGMPAMVAEKNLFTRETNARISPGDLS